MRARPCHLRISDLDGEGGEGLFSPPRRVVDGNVAKEQGKGKPSGFGRVLGTNLLANVEGGGDR